MRSKAIVIGLLADRIDVLLCHGSRVVGSRRLAVSVGHDAATWCDAVREAASDIRAAVEALGAGGAHAFVLYCSPTDVADYADVPLRSTSEACEAAVLGCAEMLTCPLDMAVCEAMVLGRDRNSASPQTHLVVAADSDEAVSAIAEMVASAGLRFIAATPIDAPLMAGLGIDAIQHSGKGNQCHLYIGERRSFFLIAGNGTLHFARPISIGIDAFVTALTRPIRMASSSETIELDTDVARRILHTVGFPERDHVIDQQRGLSGAHVIPLLQPVLQRFIVELRQSLRFGLPEEQRQSVPLMLRGPGSCLPGFAAVLGEELRLNITCDDSYRSYDYQQPGCCGSELADAIQQRKAMTVLGLQPRNIAQRLQATRLQQWLWMGAAIALAVIAFDAFRLHSRVVAARQQAAAATSNAQDLQTLHTTGERLFAAVDAMNKLDAAIARELGAQASIRAAMQELSRLTPDSIRFMHMAFSFDRGEVTGTVSGLARAGREQRSNAPLEAFIDQLRTSPLFENVTLTNVQAGGRDTTTSQTFEARFTTIAVPALMPNDALAATTAGDAAP